MWNGEQLHTEQNSTGQAVEHDVTACWLAGWLAYGSATAGSCMFSVGYAEVGVGCVRVV